MYSPDIKGVRGIERENNVHFKHKRNADYIGHDPLITSSEKRSNKNANV